MTVPDTFVPWRVPAPDRHAERLPGAEAGRQDAAGQPRDLAANRRQLETIFRKDSGSMTLICDFAMLEFWSSRRATASASVDPLTKVNGMWNKGGK
jgi:hypothetical protein